MSSPATDNLPVQVDGLIECLRMDRIPAGRARAIAQTKLDECQLWCIAAVEMSIATGGTG